jgi:serine/threonine protein kinase HipA of HipAB toxin-antitoxin module
MQQQRAMKRQSAHLSHAATRGASAQEKRTAKTVARSERTCVNFSGVHLHTPKRIANTRHLVWRSCLEHPVPHKSRQHARAHAAQHEGDERQQRALLWSYAGGEWR